MLFIPWHNLIKLHLKLKQEKSVVGNYHTFFIYLPECNTMIRSILLMLGGILLFFQQYIVSINSHTQFVIFICGILILGVPHGAADLLVASRNAEAVHKVFSKINFFTVYLFRLLLFAATLYFFPVIGNMLFILLAAYHFGETDLYQFKTNNFLGKCFVIAYGLFILSVLLFHHFEAVKPIYLMFQSGKNNAQLLNWIDLHRYTLLSVAGMLFFSTSFLYFLRNRHQFVDDKGQFIIRLAILLVLLFNLPLLLGFSFYFVVWHSVLSLNNIVGYLKYDNRFSQSDILKQLLLYSSLAILGIVLFGCTGFMFTDSNAASGYVFLGLAVLTAPHMQIMHDMYVSIRLKRADYQSITV